MALSREIRSGGGGAHSLKSQPGHIAPGHKPRARKPTPIRCEPRWRAADPSLQAAIGRLDALLERQEPPRQRRRRAHDAATFQLAIECIACNLLAVSIAAPDRPLAVPLANAASRVAPIFGKPARKVMDLMIGLGLVTKVKGYPYRGPTTIQATRKLRKLLPLGTSDWDALRIQDDRAVVVLNKRASNDPDRDDDAVTSRARPTTAETGQWLAGITDEMHAINAAILGAPVECQGSAMVHVAERPGAAMASLVTLHHRTFRRTFNGTWEEGGRLFGGFWQTMPRPDRFKNIRIGGEPVALVDYGQLFLRLAYAKAGVMPPPGDLYDMTGQDASLPNWKALRDARKKLVNALFFRTAPLVQWPGVTLTDFAEMRDAFPSGTKPRDAIKAIKAKHAAIANWFEHGHGLRFMRTESDVIVAVTLSLLRQGIVALPIHDAVLVPKCHASAAQAVMRKEAKRLTRADIPADIQTAPK
jgi:hypothetical protein